MNVGYKFYLNQLLFKFKADRNCRFFRRSPWQCRLNSTIASKLQHWHRWLEFIGRFWLPGGVASSWPSSVCFVTQYLSRVCPPVELLNWQPPPIFRRFTCITTECHITTHNSVVILPSFLEAFGYSELQVLYSILILISHSFHFVRKYNRSTSGRADGNSRTHVYI